MKFKKILAHCKLQYLVGRYPKNSDIKKLPDPRPQNENISPIAAAAVAVSALQDPVLHCFEIQHYL